MQVVQVNLHPFWRNLFLKCAHSRKLQKNH